MDVGCNCFGVATAAKVPVKRYNLLVPAVFPVAEPNAAKPLGITVEKNIKRLGEYLERNEHRIPKVSRRLARRMQGDLRQGRMGFVRVAVATYTHLITDEEGKFARLYAAELVTKYPTKQRNLVPCYSGPSVSQDSPQLGSVVGLLLTSPAPLAQRWGVDLLGAFLKVQDTAEKVEQLEALVPLLCRNADPQSTAPTTTTVPSQGSQDAQAQEAVVAGSLCALLEHLRFCSRVSFISRHLDVITYAVLGALEAAGQEGPMRAEIPQPSGVEAAALPSAGPSAPALHKQQAGDAQTGSSSSPPRAAALLVFQELAQMTRDAAEGGKVVEFVLRFLDAAPQRWLGGPAVDAGLGLIRQACTHEHQRYLLYTSLMAHVGRAARLAPTQRCAVLEQAQRDGAQLDAGMIAPALLLALQELPRAVQAAAAAPQEQGDDARRLQGDILAALRHLAGRLANRLQLTAVLGSAVGGFDGPDAAEATASLRCCAAASSAYASLPGTAAAGAVAPPLHLSNVLLRCLLGISVGWKAEQRVLAHHMMQNALAVAAGAASPPQVHSALSALWHEAALPDNAPASYAAMDTTFGLVLAAGPGQETGAMACRLTGRLQGAVLQGDAQLAGASPAQKCALLAMCASMWTRLAAHLSLSALSTLAVPGAAAVLPSLQPGPGGVGLAAGGTGAALPDGPLVQVPPADNAAAATYLQALQRGALPDVASTLTKVLPTKPVGDRPAAAEFEPLPVTALVPHMKLSTAARGRAPMPQTAMTPRAKRVLEAFKARPTPVPQGLLNGAPAAGPDQGGAVVANSVPATPRTLSDVLATVEAAVANVA